MIDMTLLSIPINASDPYMIKNVIEILTKREFEVKYILGKWTYTPHPEADLQPVLSFVITGVEAVKEILVEDDLDTIRGVEVTVRCIKTKCVIDLEEYEEDTTYGVSSVLKSKRIKVCSCRRRAPIKALEKALDVIKESNERMQSSRVCNRLSD